MKTLNLTFDEKEFKLLQKYKREFKAKSWKAFIMSVLSFWSGDFDKLK